MHISRILYTLAINWRKKLNGTIPYFNLLKSQKALDTVSKIEYS